MTLSNADHRGGIAPIRTAGQLALLLPIPLLLIIEGYAQPLFPGSTPAHPSPYVTIMGTRPKNTFPPLVGLPLHIHYEQWNTVVVPLLAGGTLAQWRGIIQNLGDLIRLLNGIIGPGGILIFPEGFPVGFSAWTEESLGALYACDWNDDQRVTGKQAEYLVMASAIIFRDARALGY